MPKIKAVLSDAGGILFDGGVHKRNLYACLKGRVPGLTNEKLAPLYHKHVAKAQGEAGYSRADAYRDILRELGIADQYKEVMEQLKGMPYNLELFPGVKETIAEFGRSGVSFIVMTDATKPGDILEGTLRDMGVQEGLTAIVSSKDIGAPKPAKEFFERILRRFGLNRDEVVFVAHDLDEVEGAHGLGYNVLALNYDPDDNLGFLPEKSKIRSFSQVLDYIRSQD